MMSHKTLAYMHEHQSEEFSLEIRQYQNHESCLGVFNQTKPREDELPVLFLHSLECWKRLSHSCQDLPEPGYFENDDNVLVDYDQYDQTIHMLMDDLVDGDMNMKGLTMEWSRMSRMIKDYAWLTGFDGLEDWMIPENNVLYFISGWNAPCVMPMERIKERKKIKVRPQKRSTE